MASIDWVNLDLQGVPISPLVESGFIFKGEHDIHSGEAWDFPIIGNYDCLEYKAKSEQFIRLSGSFHKLWNIWEGREEHNYNSFPFSAQVETIEKVCKLIGVEAKDIPVVGLEYGQNIPLPYDVKELVSRWVKVHKWASPTFRKDYGRKGYLIEFDLSKMYLKLYAKSYQFGLFYDVLRIELKTKSKAEYIQKKGIHSLADLTKPEAMELLYQDLFNRSKELIIIPDNLDQELTKVDISFLKKVQNPTYWTDLHPKPKDYSKGSYSEEYKKARRRANKDKLDTIKKVESLGADKPHKIILKELKRQKEALYILSPRPSDQHPQDVPRCKITGADISDQRKGSKFLSAKKIGEKAAKHLRNLDSNPRNNLKHRLKRLLDGQWLFDQREFITLKPRQKNQLGVSLTAFFRESLDL